MAFEIRVKKWGIKEKEKLLRENKSANSILLNGPKNRYTVNIPGFDSHRHHGGCFEDQAFDPISPRHDFDIH